MSRFITSDGLSLHYMDEGAGVPLLCLPGLTRNAFDFDDLAAALGGRHRLIRLTSRGRKPSDYDPEWHNYSVAVEARDVIEFMDHLGLSRAVVVGTSRGGLIAMLLAGVAKDRLAGVYLNDIGPEIHPEGLERIMTYVGLTPRVRTLAEAATGIAAMLAPQFPDLSRAQWLHYAGLWLEQGPERVELRYDPRIRDAVGELSAGAAEDMWPLFDAFAGVPLALVRGANTDLLTEVTVAEMRARRPDMIYASVPNRGHPPFLNEPEAVAALEALIVRAGL